MKVKNNPGDTLGTVDTLMVDLPAGRLVAVIVSSGGVLGIGNDLLAMPPALFVVNERNKTLDADITLDTLKGAPHFRASEWPNLGEAEYVETVYQAFNVSPYFRSDKAPKPQALTPLDQGNSKADITVTAEIRKALLREADLSVNGKNAKIITINGKVTLRGAVDNEGERDQIATIAGQIAGAGNVANELVIQPSASKPGKR